MKLSITLVTAAVILRFCTPGPGTFYVCSGLPGADTVQIEMAGHETNAVDVAFEVPRDAGSKVFWAWFVGDAGEWVEVGR